MRNSLCCKKIPANYCFAIPKKEAEKISKVIGFSVSPLNGLWFPCALKRGHVGDCVPSCGKLIEGRYYQVHKGGKYFQEFCVLPGGHSNKCQDRQGLSGIDDSAL
jgi:hypothetical protein